MKKQTIMMLIVSVFTSGLVSIIFQKSIPPNSSLWAQTPGVKAMLLVDGPDCPPGFEDVTATYDNRYIMIRSDVNGAPTMGGGDGAGNTSPNGGHSHSTSLGRACDGGDHAGCGNVGVSYQGDHIHTISAHIHSYVGLRMCRWVIN